jgi:putative hydrolase of the HAD superfamily
MTNPLPVPIENYDNVCFDLGGVLARICHTWGEVLRACGLPSYEPVAAEALSDCPAFDLYQSGRLGLEPYLAALGEYLGGLGPSEALMAHESILLGPYPGTAELVSDLHETGTTTGCISNTNEPHWRSMRHSGAYEAISALQHPVVSHEVGMSKPEPDLYRFYASVVGATPERIIYFDDSELNIAAARSLGWRAYRIDPHGDPSAQMRRILRLPCQPPNRP